jgi:hypothetical protein
MDIIFYHDKCCQALVVPVIDSFYQKLHNTSWPNAELSMYSQVSVGVDRFLKWFMTCCSEEYSKELI